MFARDGPFKSDANLLYLSYDTLCFLFVLGTIEYGGMEISISGMCQHRSLEPASLDLCFCLLKSLPIAMLVFTSSLPVWIKMSASREIGTATSELTNWSSGCSFVARKFHKQVLRAFHR